MRTFTSTTRFRTSSLARALIFTMALTMCVSCQPDSRPLSSDPAVYVTGVQAAHYSGNAGAPEEQACRAWRLSGEEVARFFQLSQRYEQRPYSLFYQVPCSISGTLQADGRTWQFRVDGGATATWTSGTEVRNWGCSVQACAPLVMLATDLMNPDGD